MRTPVSIAMFLTKIPASRQLHLSRGTRAARRISRSCHTYGSAMGWRSRHRLLIDTLLLGATGALCARAFVFLLTMAQRFFLGFIANYQPPTAAFEAGPPDQTIGPHGLWLIPVATTLGGLLSGLLVYALAPEAEGHGTDAVISAFHFSKGVIRARVPAVKMIASALTIGSGGSAGREGPTALINAGIASVYSRWLRRSEDEVRILVLVGMAAGLSAIFRSPIGTAIFAIEVLYGGMDFEGGALFYTMLGSVVAYAVNGLFVGTHSLFQLPNNLAAPGVEKYGWYLVLGGASGIVASVTPMALYSVRDAFRKLKIPAHLKPAIGGLLVGCIGMAFPQVLTGGYGWMQQAIDGRLTATLLLALMALKIVTFALTIGSGGSGGVFAPSLYIGAMLGGFLGWTLHQPAAGFVVVGMASVFAGAARVPIATLLMVSEMTGDYQMLVPAALSVILSYFVQASLSSRFGYRSLYE